MITALILAGGSGQRMESVIPKQFIEIEGKPLLSYTIERFQNHSLVDRIIVASISGWEGFIQELSQKFGFTKLSRVITGGKTALESIRNGIEAIEGDDDDIVIIHDGVRPLVDEKSITNVIEDCKKYGGAISSVPLIEHVVYIGDSPTDLHYIPRENAFRTVTPQAYRYGNMLKAFKKADATGIGKNSAFIGTMMMDLGEPVCLSKGSEKNIKITEPKDLVYFKTMLG